jgi:hypothetical protein
MSTTGIKTNDLSDERFTEFSKAVLKDRYFLF